MTAKRIQDSSVDQAERMIAAIIDAAEPAPPDRVELSSLPRRDRLEIAVLAAGVAGQCLSLWRRRYYKTLNRQRVDAYLAHVDRVAPVIDDDLLIEPLRHLATVETLAYTPREWNLLDPDQARVAVLAAALTLGQLGADWRKPYRRFARRLQRRLGPDMNKIDSAASGFA